MLIGYKNVFRSMIESGRKDITFRKRRNVVPKYLETVREYTGLRTKHSRIITERVLRGIFLVKIMENQIVLYATEVGPRAPELDHWQAFEDDTRRMPEFAGKLMDEKAFLEALAYRDGFPSWNVLYRWHRLNDTADKIIWLVWLGLNAPERKEGVHA